MDKFHEIFLEGVQNACNKLRGGGDNKKVESCASLGGTPSLVAECIVRTAIDLGGNFSDVREFQRKFGQLVSAKPTHLTKRKLNERIAQMQEELDEFKSAVESDDIAEQADALIDIVYFALGTACHMGLPWQELWDDVHRANMSKQRGVKPERGFLVDCIKPDGWVGPRTMEILVKNGYSKPKSDSDYLDDDIHKEDK